MSINVTIWNENRHEKDENHAASKVYPNGIHNTIKEALSMNENLVIRTATLDEDYCGLPDEVLDQTDVLIWWGHSAHAEVPDSLAEKIQQAVLKGMGFIALHSAHLSKPFVRLMGTSCTLQWRDNDRERLWNVNPSHPIAKGIDKYIELPREEMYGEFFDIPKPDDVVFLGWFAGGEVFRSGCTFQRGYGKVFYFQPGHEEYPVYHDQNIQQILRNAVDWATPLARREELSCPNPASLEK
ncbi:MAG: trehalose utilization protein ThuA [Oscillospiraceae bacterium]|nr:trehalose utilization protein ThuA [Oscillospiraceae bacterium]